MIRNSTDRYKKIYPTTALHPKTSTTPTKTKRTYTKARTQCTPQSFSKLQISTPKQLPISTHKQLQISTSYQLDYPFHSSSPSSLKSQVPNLAKTFNLLTKTSNASQQQKRYETSMSNQFCQLSISQSKEQNRRNSKQFIENLPQNSLFYCTHCFEYVFEIQKKRHYPECKNAFSVKNRESEHYYVSALGKLQKIVLLAQYSMTKTKQIEYLAWSIQRGQLQALDSISYGKDYEFFSLEQIEQAFVFTFDSLLRGVQKPSFFTCF